MNTSQRLRLQSLDDGVVRLGPQTVHIDVTNSCNVDCVTCWDHSPHLRVPKSTAWKRQRVEPADVFNLIDDIASLGGLESVIVSGMGEPFTHPQIYEILQGLKDRGLHVTVITNLLAAHPERIVELNIDTLLIGIHGASEQSYLDFHPAWNSEHWQRLNRSLEYFANAGRRDKHVHVICRHNAKELREMVLQAKRLRASQINFKFASLGGGTEAVALCEDDRLHLLRDCSAAKSLAHELGVHHNLDVLERQVQSGGLDTAPIEKIGCFIGYHYARVAVDGTVYYCCNTQVRVGSLRDEKFSQLWSGAAWQKLRAELRAGHFYSGCHQCGKVNQNIKLSQHFREQFGEARWRDASGQGGSIRRNFRRFLEVLR
jgi:MoaA/NifB/PqqE/SkfB family radical SAM enzyme